MKYIYKIMLFATFVGVSSCKKFVELGAPPTQILFDDAFKTDASAQSSVLGIYSLASGASAGSFLYTNTFYPEISGDGVQYNAADANIQEFSRNALLTTNGFVATTWNITYAMIKATNNVISGVNASTTLTAAGKNQFLGEAKFMRAFYYFHLVNLYGDIPLVLKDDYAAFENATLPRTPVAQVYTQIIKDLTDAKAALPTTYVGTFRGRVNKHAATALLARVYLYQKQYANAEAEATLVIGAGTYSLPAPASAFINTSNEVIWQIGNVNGFTPFAPVYVTAATVVPAYTLTPATYQNFEATDLRRANWITPKTISGTTYYAITKYKIASGTGTEYSVALRLAEQYLIRAEARAQLNNLSGAKNDLDVVRARAGLAAVSITLTQTEMLTAIEQERKLEFFGEFGHRWFDLKRTNRADAVLGALRPTTWRSTAVLYPIPDAQIIINANLTQNTGYPF